MKLNWKVRVKNKAFWLAIIPAAALLVQVAAAVTAVVLICAAIAHFGGANPVSKVLRTVFSPFQNGVAYITNKVKDTCDKGEKAFHKSA